MIYNSPPSDAPHHGAGMSSGMVAGFTGFKSRAKIGADGPFFIGW
jgi:hypothetical protein